MLYSFRTAEDVVRWRASVRKYEGAGLADNEPDLGSKFSVAGSLRLCRKNEKARRVLDDTGVKPCWEKPLASLATLVVHCMIATPQSHFWPT